MTMMKISASFLHRMDAPVEMDFSLFIDFSSLFVLTPSQLRSSLVL